MRPKEPTITLYDVRLGFPIWVIRYINSTKYVRSSPGQDIRPSSEAGA